jgi:hypothetical protein
MPSHQEEKDSREHTEHENANNPAGLKHLKDVVLGPSPAFRGINADAEVNDFFAVEPGGMIHVMACSRD